MLRVRVIPKSGQAVELDFGQPAIRIGRGPENEIHLPQNGVSKHHATLHVAPNGAVTLVDERSTNGTYVDTERLVTPRLMRADEDIHIGDFTLRLVSLAELAPTQVLTLGQPSAFSKPSAPQGPQVTVNPHRRRR
jgi:pilus assembly protein CpaF